MLVPVHVTRSIQMYPNESLITFHVLVLIKLNCQRRKDIGH